MNKQDDHEQTKFTETNSSQSVDSSFTSFEGLYYKIKLSITIVTVILCSYQVYDITTVKLQHSRNFIRYLNYYLLEHTDFDIYWAGQTGLNYPIHEYYQIEDVQDFLSRLQENFMALEDSVYGQIDLDKITQQDEHQIYLQTKYGQIQQYPYTIAQGFQSPFRIEDLNSIKNAILRSEDINIVYKPFQIQSHLWHLTVSIKDYSQCSIFVQIYAKEKIAVWTYHIGTFLCGLSFLFVLVKHYLCNPSSLYSNLPDYMLAVLLCNTFLFSLNEHSQHVEWLIIVDGIQCLVAWLLILKFLTKQDDYHISFLIKKSYILVGRIFVSFGPVFIAFVLFAYMMFSREAWQFSTFRRTFLNLFYISYYNMTYESFIVTSRTNPISIIFFMAFVILFTICVYSGMLVSVFCSYVWNKRESKVKEDIINNLKIQCSECDHKYKYIDCIEMAKQNPKKSLRMSMLLQIDFTNSQERYKYKSALQRKIGNLNEKLIKIIDESRGEIKKSQSDRNIKEHTLKVLGLCLFDFRGFLKQIKTNENIYEFEPKTESKKNV